MTGEVVVASDPGDGPAVMVRWITDRRLTLALAALALASFWIPQLASALELDRGRGAQVWRWLGCHWTHFDLRHLFYSGTMFVGLAAFLEPRGRRRLLIGILGAALAIPVFLLTMAPDISIYRGLSGVDSALFVMVLARIRQEAGVDRRRPIRIASAVIALGFVVKLGYEVFAGRAAFADSPMFVPVPLAHAVGAIVGLLVASGGTWRVSSAPSDGPPACPRHNK